MSLTIEFSFMFSVQNGIEKESQQCVLQISLLSSFYVHKFFTWVLSVTVSGERTKYSSRKFNNHKRKEKNTCEELCDQHFVDYDECCVVVEKRKQMKVKIALLHVVAQ